MSIRTKELSFLEGLPDISFIDNKTLEDIQAEMVADYQEKYREVTGRELKLRRADPETLKLYAVSVQIYHMYLHIDMSGKMGLLKYSYGKFLDSLGALRGVERLEAVPATVTVRFTLSAARPSVVSIPQGTRVSDGEIYFQTDETSEIAIGDIYADIPCTCMSSGEAGNGILAGAVNTMVDPLPYVEKVANIEVSMGGSDKENDDDFAYRIYLAPSRYSVAGPVNAYEYHTKSYSASIGDVQVSSPHPGEVEVMFLLTDGSLPTEGMCREVLQYLDADDIRPLTDHVSVLAPTEKGFAIQFTYYINRADRNRAVAVQKAVEAAVGQYVKWQTGVIGRDINPSMLTKTVMQAGAKRVDIKSPVFEEVPDGYVARVSAQAVTYGGIEDD